MSLIDTVTKNLPKNPAEAAVALAQRIDRKVIETENHTGTALEYRALARFIVRFCEKFELPIYFNDMNPAGRALDDDDTALVWLQEHAEKLRKFQLKLDDRKADGEIENLISK